MDKELSLNKTYRSEGVEEQPLIEADKCNNKRPSWVRINLDKKIIFIKLLVNGEAFWYRRYFQDYFFILDPSSEDYRNYYNSIAENYESFIPQNKEMRKFIVSFLKKLKIRKEAK